jgi:hypothetical protein
MLMLCLSLGIVSGCTELSAANPFAPTQTNSFEMGLADHLKRTGAKMYGAYWCPHCSDQKAMFKQAVSHMPYVECDSQGVNPQPQLCEQKKIEGYPTWEIQGKLYPGVQSLLELARLSNYQVPSASSMPLPKANP